MLIPGASVLLNVFFIVPHRILYEAPENTFSRISLFAVFLRSSQVELFEKNKCPVLDSRIKLFWQVIISFKLESQIFAYLQSIKEIRISQRILQTAGKLLKKQQKCTYRYFLKHVK